MRKLAIDFGTTNSVVAHWDDETEEALIVPLAGISNMDDVDLPATVPSLLYVNNGRSSGAGQPGDVTVGHMVQQNKLDKMHDNRLFRNFKRGIVSGIATR